MQHHDAYSHWLASVELRPQSWHSCFHLGTNDCMQHRTSPQYTQHGTLGHEAPSWDQLVHNRQCPQYEFSNLPEPKH